MLRALLLLLVLVVPAHAEPRCPAAPSFPEPPPLPAELLAHARSESARVAAVREASATLEDCRRRNVEWFAAVDTLEREKAIWSLQAALGNPSVDVQLHALRSLARLGDRRAVRFLLTYGERMNTRVSGSEEATLHAVRLELLAQTLSTLTGVPVAVKGQDTDGIARGLKKWHQWLAENQGSIKN